MQVNNINLENAMEPIDKVYIHCLDHGAEVWIPTNARRLSDNEFLILPNDEFNESNTMTLCEFIPGDIVSLGDRKFQDDKTILVCNRLIKASIHPDKKFFEFLFRASIGQLEINKTTFDNYRQEIEKIKQQQISGELFYSSVLSTIDCLVQFIT